MITDCIEGIISQILYLLIIASLIVMFPLDARVGGVGQSSTGPVALKSIRCVKFEGL